MVVYTALNILYQDISESDIFKNAMFLMLSMVKIQNFSRMYALMLLAASPRHGYELIKELEHSLGKKISAAEVYPFLKELKKQG